MIRNLKMLVIENSRTRWWGQIEHSTTLVPLNSDGQFWIHELANKFVLAVVVDDPFLDPSFRSAQGGMVVVFPVGSLFLSLVNPGERLDSIYMGS